MSTRPSRDQPADDAADEELVRRVADRQAAHLSRTHGERVEVPVDLDPDKTRHRCGVQRDAIAVALWVLRCDGALVPDAVDAAAQRCPNCGLDNLPIDVARVLLARVHDDHRTGVRAALGAVLADWKRRGDRFTRARIELTVWRLAATVRAAIVAAAVAEGSGAIDHNTGQPVPEPADQLTNAAEFAADTAIGQLKDRLADELGALAGLP